MMRREDSRQIWPHEAKIVIDIPVDIYRYRYIYIYIHTHADQGDETIKGDVMTLVMPHINISGQADVVPQLHML